MVAGADGATDDCESDIRVSSDENPGIRILWFRSIGKNQHCSAPVRIINNTDQDVTEDLAPLMYRHLDVWQVDTQS